MAHARAKIRPKKGAKANKRKGLWKGSIAFGLVNIPIYLESAESATELHFHLLDKRDHSPVGYKKFNKRSGKELTQANLIKGYEYEKGKFVLLNNSDFEKANLKATRTIDIEDFISLSEVNPMLFERPYYVIPQEGAEKGYVLLREALKRTKKAGIAKIVLHTVQHLVALMAREDYIILEILRFADEVRDISNISYFEPSLKKMKVSGRELDVAEQLVAGMTSAWNPKKYHDSYRDDLIRLINSKIKKGNITKLEAPVSQTSAEKEPSLNLLDLTALLKKSLSATKGKRAA